MILDAFFERSRGGIGRRFARREGKMDRLGSERFGVYPIGGVCAQCLVDDSVVVRDAVTDDL